MREWRSSGPRHYIIAADSLEDLTVELARRLELLAPHTGGVELDGAFLANLYKTIDRFNEYAVDGRDPEFHRGETPIEKAWAGPRRTGAANGTMHPLTPAGPYYCVILGPGALDTKGGPVTDGYGRVLDGENRWKKA